MSSTDLADEKTKQEIEIFEKEALEHSTLTTITAPRAKITHKGFEDIEDVTGMGQRNQDALREEEERMERGGEKTYLQMSPIPKAMMIAARAAYPARTAFSSPRRFPILRIQSVCVRV